MPHCNVTIFFFNDTATTEIYTLSLHDALPIYTRSAVEPFLTFSARRDLREKVWRNFVDRGDNGGKHDNNAIITEILQLRDRKSTRLNFSHANISYAVFCLKKKKNAKITLELTS